jgi:uncharacterized protein YndB with AHSA1/START domain
MSDEITHEAPLDAPPETVWRALEDETLRERWLAPADVPAGQGGPIDCEVIEAEPPHRLRLAWSSRDGALQSEVTFTVTPRQGGSHLRIVHSGLGAKAAPVSNLKMAA